MNSRGAMDEILPVVVKRLALKAGIRTVMDDGVERIRQFMIDSLSELLFKAKMCVKYSGGLTVKDSHVLLSMPSHRMFTNESQLYRIREKGRKKRTSMSNPTRPKKRSDRKNKQRMHTLQTTSNVIIPPERVGKIIKILLNSDKGIEELRSDNEIVEKWRVSKVARSLIQYWLEEVTTCLLRKTALLVDNTGRSRVHSRHIDLALFISGETNLHVVNKE